MLVLSRQRRLLLFILLTLFPVGRAIGSGDEAPDAGDDGPGFRMGFIPAFAYDSDLGFKYGMVFNLFDYRQRTPTKRYDQHLFLRFTNTTGGSFQVQGLLESETLINNSVTLIEMGHIADRKYDFYGFNGNGSIYNPKHIDSSDPGFLSSNYYAYKRSYTRLRFDNQFKAGNGNLRFLTGFMFNLFSIGSASESSGQNEGLGEKAGTTTLFDKYLDRGVIPGNEREGGMINLLSVGLVYDTRNDLCYCTDGIWAETILFHSPSLLSDNSFSKLILTYRHHASALNEMLTFSFRISSQQKLGGNIPFYMLPLYFDSRMSQDGLGGAFNLRGALRNRVLADGFVAGNVETKLKLSHFQIFGRELFFSISFFYDNGFVTQEYGIEQGNVPDGELPLHFNEAGMNIHHTVGTGAYIVFNKDNVISINYGVPLDRQNGPGGLYVGSSLLF